MDNLNAEGGREIGDDHELLKLVQKEQIEQRNWADIPNELLCDIFSRLIAGDRIMFQLVCTWWKSANQLLPRRPNSLNNAAPYLMLPNNNKLFDPIHQEYQCIDFRERGEIWVVKHGWLLMTYLQNQIFFYNPFTKEQVNLPNFPRKLYNLQSICFSSPPTSTNWVVVVVHGIPRTGIHLYSFGSQDEDWSKYEVRKDYGCLGLGYAYRNIVMCKGLYYLLDHEDATLMIHDPLTKKSDFHKAPESISQLISGNGSQKYMLESNGKMLAVFVSTDGSTVSTYKWINGTWESVLCLEEENNMVFLSRTSSFCQGSTVKGTGNKIYFPRFIGGHNLFYSLSSKRYHTFEMGTSYVSFHGSKLHVHSAWIKPS